MEAILLGSLPAVTASTKQPFPISGTLPDGYELRGLIQVANITHKSTAAAFNLAVADHNTIANALWVRTRMKAWGIDDVYNLNPVEGRTIAAYATAQDPFIVDQKLRVGTSVPLSGGTAQAAILAWPIWFTHRHLEYPEMFAPSTDQFNVDGHKLTVELGAGGTGLVLTNGTANIVLSGIDVYGIVAPADTVHFGPAHYMRQLTVAQTRVPEDGDAVDMILADERDPYTLAVQIAQVSVTRGASPNTRTSPQNATPPVLAQRFLEAQESVDGNRPIDLTSNSLGGTGSQITPYIYIDGGVRSTEWQLPVYRKNRTVFQNPASGGSAAATWLSWQIRPIAEVQKEMKKLLGRYQFLKAASLDDLDVRGGGGRDNSVLADFKARYLRLKPATKAA